jgi:hypothetical protein
MSMIEVKQNYLNKNKNLLFRGGLSVFLIAAALGLASCGMNIKDATEQENKILIEKGFSGEHPIIDLRSVPGFSTNGNISGGFLAFNGEFEGKTTTMLQFAWKTKEEDDRIQISEVPISRIKFFVTEEKNTKPTVLFTEVNTENLLKRDEVNFGYETQNSDNLNNYVAQSSLVIISLSQDDYNKFRETK